MLGLAQGVRVGTGRKKIGSVFVHVVDRDDYCGVEAQHNHHSVVIGLVVFEGAQGHSSRYTATPLQLVPAITRRVSERAYNLLPATKMTVAHHIQLSTMRGAMAG